MNFYGPIKSHTNEVYGEETKQDVYERGYKQGRIDLLIEMGYWMPL